MIVGCVGKSQVMYIVRFTGVCPTYSRAYCRRVAIATPGFETNYNGACTELSRDDLPYPCRC